LADQVRLPAASTRKGGLFCLYLRLDNHVTVYLLS
jgi:hypothetical protein